VAGLVPATHVGGFRRPFIARRKEEETIVRTIPTLLAATVVLAWGTAASAGQQLDRVKAQKVVHCGSVERPGLAKAAGEGTWAGLSVDVCRAVAAAVLGSADRIAFTLYEGPQQFDRIRNGEDDIAFLTGSEIRDNLLAGKVLPGPAVFFETHAVMVPTSAAEQHVGELAGKTICFLTGSPAQRSLEAYFQAKHATWLHIAYSEDGEMTDGYNVQQCHAVADEMTDLAALRHDDPGVNQLTSRILPEPLSVFPVVAVTGTNDAQWAAAVAWTVHTLVSAERPETPWYAGGVGALPIQAKELGIEDGWQQRVIGAVGDYGAIFARNLGDKSPLKLERGVNANQINGGLLLSPFVE
jgi:general L-amino acid transport system substrate-binding protein